MPDPTPEHAERAQDLAGDLLRATDPLDRKQAVGAIARALADAEELAALSCVSFLETLAKSKYEAARVWQRKGRNDLMNRIGGEGHMLAVSAASLRRKHGLPEPPR